MQRPAYVEAIELVLLLKLSMYIIAQGLEKVKLMPMLSSSQCATSGYMREVKSSEGGVA